VCVCVSLVVDLSRTAGMLACVVALLLACVIILCVIDCVRVLTQGVCEPAS